MTIHMKIIADIYPSMEFADVEKRNWYVGFYSEKK